MKETKLSSEITIENNISNEDETNNLIEKMDFDKDEMNDSFLLDIPKKKKKIINVNVNAFQNFHSCFIFL